MIDKSSLLKNQGSLYLEFSPKGGLFHKMLLLSLMGFLTGWCSLSVAGWLGTFTHMFVLANFAQFNINKIWYIAAVYTDAEAMREFVLVAVCILISNK